MIASRIARALLGAGSILFACGLAAPRIGAQSSARQNPTRHSDTTTLVILGVDHSAQLAARQYHAGYFRAFFDRVHPKAICVERSPDEFARADYYEFTYEAQHIAVPYAREHGIAICPIDWIFTKDDERLAFGRLEVADPPMIRPTSGFQSFLTLDSASLGRTLFFADSDAARAQTRAFFDAPRASGPGDFPRRLDLYRTYMQAMRILEAARAYRGDTVLVVVGYLHKEDIERTLSGIPGLHIVQPSAIAATSSTEADSLLTRTDLAAILSFNLLGVQSSTRAVDWTWVSSILDRFATAAAGTAELRLMRTRFAVLHKQLAPRDAAQAYETIAKAASDADVFTCRAAEDRRRIDTYYDPFGNLNVRQRALVEAAREWMRAGDPSRATAIRTQLVDAAHWSPVAHGEFDVYWDSYIAGAH